MVSLRVLYCLCLYWIPYLNSFIGSVWHTRPTRILHACYFRRNWPSWYFEHKIFSWRWDGSRRRGRRASESRVICNGKILYMKLQYVGPFYNQNWNYTYVFITYSTYLLGLYWKYNSITYMVHSFNLHLSIYIRLLWVASFQIWRRLWSKSRSKSRSRNDRAHSLTS